MELTQDELEWLLTALGLMMRLARHWDDMTGGVQDHANAVRNRVSMALMQAQNVNPRV